MTIKQTVNQMRDLLQQITSDLEKADAGNKAASQRVRTGTIKLEKIAKKYRKESVKHDKAPKARKKAAPKKAAGGKKAAKKKGVSKPVKKMAAVKKKAPARKAKTTARKFSVKRRRQTAKLPPRVRTGI